MNIHQLEYIVALDSQRNFVKAAEKCHVTQATLSMMVKKLEEELGAVIFDRSKQPVIPTEIGRKIIMQARRVLSEATRIKELINEEKGEVSGELKIGIIPTLSPYLLPLFLRKFTIDYPQVKLIISEHTTDLVIQHLKSGQLDAGILATPLNDISIKEQPLFYEKYFLYVNDKEKGFNKQYVLPTAINIDRLWLLEEGHCMRSQILNLCELKKRHEAEETVHYESGSIESLKNIVDTDFGMTIIPELATFTFNNVEKNRLRLFAPPSPVREISIVTHREYIKIKLIQVLSETILSTIPDDMKNNKKKLIL
jgi:LysR family transcriptional regulator, hydrogen peroxide-inducible genes activator